MAEDLGQDFSPPAPGRLALDGSLWGACLLDGGAFLATSLPDARSTPSTLDNQEALPGFASSSLGGKTTPVVSVHCGQLLQGDLGRVLQP